MKKLFALLLTLVMVCSLAACGKKEEPAQAPAEAPLKPPLRLPPNPKIPNLPSKLLPPVC